MIKLRLTALLAVALLAACGGAGPDADQDKSPDEIKKAAAEMSADELQKIVDAYAEAINKEKDDAKLKDLQQKSAIYAQALLKKKTGGKLGG